MHISDNVRRLGRLMLDGDICATEELSRILQRQGFGNKLEGVFEFGDEVEVCEKWRPRKNKTSRITLAWWPGSEDGDPDFSAESPRFLHRKRHWSQKTGYVIDDGVAGEHDRLFGSRAMKAYATVALLWDPPGFSKVKVVSWVLGPSNYRLLGEAQRKTPFGGKDIRVEVLDQRYQLLDLTVFSGPSHLMNEGKESYAQILKNASKAPLELPEHLGKVLSIEEIEERLKA